MSLSLYEGGGDLTTEGERIISWSLMKDLIRKFHVCPFCFKPLTGEDIIYEIGDRKHPHAYKADYGKRHPQAVSFPVFSVHNHCPVHGFLTGDCSMKVREGLEETTFLGAISKAAELGWVIGWES